MKLALISDIHSNLPALEAVLEDMPEGIDDIVCLGDIVGYGPWPKECLDLARKHCSTVVQGNHDREVRDPTGYTQNQMAMDGLWYAQAHLPDEDIEWLQSLPRKTEYNDDILLVHDHPEHVDKYVYPSEFPNIRRYMDDYEATFLGHTHVQHKAVIDDRLILNPGSIGQPRDKDPKAAYAIVDTDTLESEFYRVEYDIEQVKQKVKNTEGLPLKIAQRLAEGR